MKLSSLYIFVYIFTYCIYFFTITQKINYVISFSNRNVLKSKQFYIYSDADIYKIEYYTLLWARFVSYRFFKPQGIVNPFNQSIYIYSYYCVVFIFQSE